MSQNQQKNNKNQRLELYSSWKTCSACGLPPKNDDNDTQKKKTKKLSVCRNCKCRAYHDSVCQKFDWTTANNNNHRKECPILSKAMIPLRQLIQIYESSSHSSCCHQEVCCCCWWWWSSSSSLPLHDDENVKDNNQLSTTRAKEFNTQWEYSAKQWYQQDYLNAMEGFQHSLEPYQKAWDNILKNLSNNNNNGDNNIAADIDNRKYKINQQQSSEQKQHLKEKKKEAIILSKRLLFCAYCEMDGQQIDIARQRLVQCLSILLIILESSLVEEQQPAAKNDATTIINTTTIIDIDDDDYYYYINEILDDAWMELMLSMEEDPMTRPIAKHVANLAISSGRSCCNWYDPLQRPGYMAPLLKQKQLQQQQYFFTPSDEQPSWCTILEKHWKSIHREYQNLQHNPKFWTKVGSGQRGSGYDDHRVVSGQNWTEYVLFGTSTTNNEWATGNNDDYHQQQQQQEEEENNDGDDAPITKNLLRQYIPDAISLAEAGGGEVIFSRLAPRTRIGAHCGPTNLRLTAHLGLVVPTKATNAATDTDTTTNGSSCRIRVGSDWDTWQVGKVLMFDDSYEHEVRNDTNQERVVLLIRTWHPAVPKQDRNQWIGNATMAKDMAVEKRYRAPG